MSAAAKLAELLDKYKDKAKPVNPISEQRQKWIKLDRDLNRTPDDVETKFAREIDQLYINGQITREEMEKLFLLLIEVTKELQTPKI